MPRPPPSPLGPRQQAFTAPSSLARQASGRDLTDCDTRQRVRPSAGTRHSDRSILNGLFFAAHSVVLILPEPAFSEGWLQMIEPGGLFVVFGKERPLHPVRVTPLNEAQHENLLARDLGHALDFDLAGTGTHARTARGTRQPGNLLHRIPIDLPRTCQGHLEIVARPRVTLNEHVVRDDAEPDLARPHARPHVRVIIDVSDQRALRTNDRTG